MKAYLHFSDVGQISPENKSHELVSVNRSHFTCETSPVQFPIGLHAQSTEIFDESVLE